MCLWLPRAQHPPSSQQTSVNPSKGLGVGTRLSKGACLGPSEKREGSRKVERLCFAGNFPLKCHWVQDASLLAGRASLFLARETLPHPSSVIEQAQASMRVGKSSCGLIRGFLNLIWSHFCHQLGEKIILPETHLMNGFALPLWWLSSEFMRCLPVLLKWRVGRAGVLG